MSTNVCSRCGSPVRSDARFCGTCGAQHTFTSKPASNPALVSSHPSEAGAAFSTEPGPIPATLTQGVLLQSRYQILEVLGKGGFGAVYKALDLSLQRICAVKENLDTSPEAHRQFMREATVLANLTHTNLPRVTDYFSLIEQGQYLVMDFVDGEDLQHYVQRHGPVPPQQALSWVSQIIDALNYLHTRQPPVVHRDIKPANIRITPESRVVLVDFGLVKFYSPQLRTTMGARAVTPSYSPPEQYGMGQTDVRSDIYALGATLYTLLTGGEPPESVQRVAQDDLLPIHVINPQVPLGISQAVAHAMALSPSQRYQSVSEFKTGLLTPGAAPSIPASQPPPPTAAAGRTGRPTWLPWLIALAALSLVCGTGVGLAWKNGWLDTILSVESTPTAKITAVHFPTETDTATLHPSDTPLQPTGIPTLTEVVVLFTNTPIPTDTALPPLPTTTQLPTLAPTSPPPVGDYDLAFASDRTGVMQIFLMDTKDPNHFTSLPIPTGYNWAWWPSFCADWIAAEVQDYNGSSIQWIYLLYPSSGETTRFEPQGSFDSLGVPRCSPDGRYLSFSAAQGKQWPMFMNEIASGELTKIFQSRIAGYVSWPTAVDHFYFMSIETTGKPFIIQPVLNFFSLSGWNIGPQIAEGKYPAVSPDGSYLAYICRNTDYLCIIELSSGNSILDYRVNYVKVKYKNKDITVPSTAMWSVDGQWLYFSSVEGGDWDIFRMRSDGSGVENLTQDWPSNELTPALQW